MTKTDRAADDNVLVERKIRRRGTGDRPRSRRARVRATEIELAHWASLGNTREVKRVLKRKCDVNAPDAEGHTPLHAATFRGHFETVVVLLAKGADAFARTPDGETAVDLAADAGHEALVLLLEKW